MEYINQVDPKTGKFVQKVARDLAHKEGICHEVIHCWVINKNRKVLLQYRSKQKSQYADCYHMAIGGHIEHGDSPLETVIKEGEEEMGIDIDEGSLRFLFNDSEKIVVPETGETDNEYRHIYLYNLMNEKYGDLDSAEVESLEWVSLNDLENMIRDEELYKQMLPHKKEYYYRVIEEIRTFGDKA